MLKRGSTILSIGTTEYLAASVVLVRHGSTMFVLNAGIL
jgi:hypothetical protein